MVVFNALNNHAPSHLPELLTPHSQRGNLKKDRSFALAAPKLRNSLPLETDPALFKVKLKTHLFKLAFNLQ